MGDCQQRGRPHDVEKVRVALNPAFENRVGQVASADQVAGEDQGNRLVVDEEVEEEAYAANATMAAIVTRTAAAGRRSETPGNVSPFLLCSRTPEADRAPYRSALPRVSGRGLLPM